MLAAFTAQLSLIVLIINHENNWRTNARYLNENPKKYLPHVSCVCTFSKSSIVISHLDLEIVFSVIGQGIVKGNQIASLLGLHFLLVSCGAFDPRRFPSKNLTTFFEVMYQI